MAEYNVFINVLRSTTWSWNLCNACDAA